jgi:hypothetical protein
MRKKEIDQAVFEMTVVRVMFGNPFTSFDLMVECVHFLFFRNVGHNRDGFISEVILIDHRNSNQLFFDATEEVKIANNDIRGVWWIWNSPISQARYLVRYLICGVTWRIIKMHPQLATRTITSRSGIQLMPWYDNL